VRRSPKQVENYRNKISGSLPDPIDIRVEAPTVEDKKLSSDELAESSQAIREQNNQNAARMLKYP
jgi:magnesium chelatase family protein